MNVRWIAAMALVGCADPSADGWTGEAAPAEVGTPIGDPVTVEIGPSGGELRSDDGRFALIVPEGALPDLTELTVQRITDTAWGGLGDGYRLSPTLSFEAPVSLVWTYEDGDLDGTVEEALGIAAQEADGYWLAFGDGRVDPESRTVTVETEELGAPVPVGRGAGSIDFAAHWRFGVDPGETTVKLGARQALKLVSCTATDTFGWPFDDGVELGPPAPYVHGGPVDWSVTGSPTGTVTTGASKATYTAPTARSAAGRTNWATASFAVGPSRFAPKATLHLEDEPETWVGTSTVVVSDGQYTADVTWTRDDTHPGEVRWFTPSGTVHATMPAGDCTYRPLDGAIAPEDGLLQVDYTTDPPTYSGAGATVWVMDVICPGATVSVPFAAAWFGDAEDVITTLGEVKVGDSEVISDIKVIAGATISWTFTKQ